MKRGLILVTLVFLLGGCKEKTKTTTACIGVQEGILVDQQLVALDDRVTSTVILNTYPFELYQIDKNNTQQIEMIIDSLESQLCTDVMDGYHCEVTKDDENVIVKVEIDYSVVNMDKLRELGLISGSSDEVSLDLTIKNLEKNGLSCQSK